ncbi:hypothetical protein AVEN_70241-1 [Araneus ventricosus]|uniref:Uncharacterized protein n=1 Tax=Araneus ventricosus TaxID=182803 RepID=A0A4Y2GD05_ARAVE|nr:hypothetical protein AVEN_70241-1 [Araneus ventricosus]
MTDKTHTIFVLEFSRTFVNVVNHVLFPGIDKAPDQNDLSIAFMKPLKLFLDRHKMELYFLYREELARFKKELDEKSFKELLESMISDLKADEYDSQEFSYFCIVLSYFAAISRKNNIPTALKVAARVIIDAIEHFEKDHTIKDDIIEGIKDSLMKTAERIIAQKMSDIEKNEERE